MPSATLSFARFLRGIPPFFRHRLTIDEAERTIRADLANRDATFLETVKTLVYDRPSSPYRRLLDLVQCEFGDLSTSVERNGIEETLRSLRRDGVYISFEEFKGRTPIVRDGKHIDVHPGDFANPLLRRSLMSTTGGSTGPAVQSPIDLARLEFEAPVRMMEYRVHDVLGAPTAAWREPLPAAVWVTEQLADARFGQVHERWFATPSPFGFPSSVRYRVATMLIHRAARVGGVRLPSPKTVPYERADVVARWAATNAERHGRALVRASVSQAVRVAIAADERGLDLSGVTFLSGSEPPTSGKVRTIEASGAKFVPNYVTSEVGRIGVGCTHPRAVNDLHFYRHALSVIQHPRTVGDVSVDCFLFTSVIPLTPAVLLNVESDDYGTIETRSCPCEFGALGFTEHIVGVQSASKLTGEGVTLVGNEMIRVLEEVLPSRFGGTALDYQLLEEEEAGLTRLTLLIDPRVPITDEAAVIDATLAAIGSSRHATDVQHIWRNAGTLRVRRARPVVTKRGKQLPLVRASIHGTGSADNDEGEGVEDGSVFDA